MDVPLCPLKLRAHSPQLLPASPSGLSLRSLTPLSLLWVTMPSEDTMDTNSRLAAVLGTSRYPSKWTSGPEEFTFWGWRCRVESPGSSQAGVLGGHVDQPLRLNSIVDWALKSTLPDQNTVLEESVFHSMGQVRHSVCGGSERHSFLTLHDVLFPGFPPSCSVLPGSQRNWWPCSRMGTSRRSSNISKRHSNLQLVALGVEHFVRAQF